MSASRSAATSIAVALLLVVFSGATARTAAQTETTPPDGAAAAAAPQPPATASGEAKAPSLPIEIEAEQGIEWFRDQQIVYARGNARAVRGDLVVTADVLGARYRDRPDGGQEVWQLNASGNVKIASPDQTAVGENGTYNLDSGVLLLHGEPARLVSGGDMITANRELEYSTKTEIIIARGDATARQKDQLIKADEITAHLSRQPNGGSRLQRIEADRNVSVVTPQEVIRGNRGDYNVTSGMATITGNVKITRGANQLSGCRGEIDMNAGVSRLSSCGGEDQPVRGLILPGASGDKQGATPR